MDFYHGDQYFSLQDMSVDDIPCLLTIEQQCHSHPWKASHFTSSIQSSHQGYVLWDANKEGHRESHRGSPAIIAYAITSTVVDEAELLNLTVAPPYQRQGIGKHLLEWIARSFDASIRTLFLEVRASNQPAIALYDQLNFNEVGIRPNYYPAPKKLAAKGREDAIIMAKSLDL